MIARIVFLSAGRAAVFRLGLPRGLERLGEVARLMDEAIG